MQATYNKRPFVEVPASGDACVVGWDEIAARLSSRAGHDRLIVDCYPGANEEEITRELAARLHPELVIRAHEALKTEAEINRLCEPFLGANDPVFGFLSPLTLNDFFDSGKVAGLRRRIESARGRMLVVGIGAALLSDRGLVVYADLARWEIQRRQRAKEIGNLAVSNAQAAASLKYKRAFFIDWRAADRWKKPLLARMDFLLDTNDPAVPKFATGEAVRRGLMEAVKRPFRVVPFFDPGPWGGQWMKDVCGLDKTAVNYAWCFDCVPEENSLLLRMGGRDVEIPAIDLVFTQPRALLGDPVHARFGAEFPIRFDFLDTMDGGNLSFQVHPLTEYIQENFGMHYTQDESYYLLDAAPGACVYLGLKEGVDRAAMVRDLRSAQSGGPPFPDASYVNRFPAKKHDHFLIPAGTCHCSGKNSMVLEISATPYIFTFKMWDWGRVGLDGRPRPIHLEHGLANIQWERTTNWVKRELINRVSPMGSGPGWREERTGLHAREFIETRRHWFTGPVSHDTGSMERGSVNVLNLVEGTEAIVESPDAAFAPFPVHYAETFIVPAAVGRYTVRPAGSATTKELGTIKASVRRGLC